MYSMQKAEFTLPAINRVQYPSENACDKAVLSYSNRQQAA